MCTERITTGERYKSSLIFLWLLLFFSSITGSVDTASTLFFRNSIRCQQLYCTSFRILVRLRNQYNIYAILLFSIQNNIVILGYMSRVTAKTKQQHKKISLRFDIATYTYTHTQTQICRCIIDQHSRRTRNTDWYWPSTMNDPQPSEFTTIHSSLFILR